ncbi:MAG: polysaccharide pyruvyl transferase family protein [Lachnospiraceae bacterium]|nr:polysaccharide pyruvyl transferase family protein [Lachnospiraceae bacterium]
MNQNKVVLYAHAGSGNHGCEALANTICKMIKKPVVLVTNSVEEDEHYSLSELCEIVPEQNIRKKKLMHILYYGWRLLTKDKESFLRYRFKNVLGNHSCLWNLSIGGDNYCYESMIHDLILTNRMFHRNGGKTLLLGCSIEPESLKSRELVADMMLYDAIFARESITYNALKEVGVKNLYLYPDSAFTLDTKYLPLPEGFQVNNTVGINISPMIVENETSVGMTMKNYKALIQYILENTDMSVALIPHVVWSRNDDRVTIEELYYFFKDEPRVVKLGDCSCEELKGYISRCRFFIGARTHATIAAYSSKVPTLVVGYSVKAKGIAKDLFGTHEKYVEPVQNLETEEQLLAAFQWLYSEEKNIKKKLEEVMPAYVEKAKEAGDMLQKLMGEA